MSENRRMSRHQKPRKLKRWVKVVILLIGLLFVGTTAYAASVYMDAKSTVNKEVFQAVDSIDENVGKDKISKEEPLNILLLGVDKRPGDTGRSDALMVLSLRPGEDKMKIVSIPRDTRVDIAGQDYGYDKINHAFAFGGAGKSVATVEDFLDIELDYYVSMNMQGLSDMVDAIGGITVNNEIEWYDEGYYKKGYHYEKGKIKLNGPKTMGYVRMRHLDPRGDLGRTMRERQVIKAVINKGASFNSVGKIGDMLDVLGKNMSTNLDFEDMKGLFLNYRNVRKNIETYRVEGEPTNIEGVFYFETPEEEIQKVHDMLSKKE
ncbi:LCP family glycopolymer transferase [Virgibacillus siamensis]|uniref:LCP family glycopolymer transferase n=1 Tax=Virgibacillus siamensis TaxID=480071 RepID=UPI00098769DB|nr:LCP family protein [Virgibacillus siamensis]